MSDEEQERERHAGTEPTDPAAFKARVGEFHDDFSIKAYLKLRADFPGVHIPIQRLGGFDAISPLARRLEPFGIKPRTISSVMDANPEAIEQVALVLLEHLDRERALQSAGQAHLQSRGLAPTTSACLTFVCICFEAMEWNDEPQNISAPHFLLQQLLLPGRPELRAEMDRDHLRETILLNAALMHHEHGKPPSFREIARRLGRAPTSVSRLFAGPEAFSAEVVGFADSLEHIAPGKLDDLLAQARRLRGR